MWRCVLFLTACGGASSSQDLPDSGPSSFALPPLGGGLDYQLGGAYSPPTGVTIVSRDRTASIAEGLYSLCYVNGFQIQPEEEAFWMSMHPDLILRTGDAIEIWSRRQTAPTSTTAASS